MAICIEAELSDSETVKVPLLMNDGAASAPGEKMAPHSMFSTKKVPRLSNAAPSANVRPSELPVHETVWPTGLVRVRPSSSSLDSVVPVKMPPLALTAPEPEIVPESSVNGPVTVMSPVPVSVPPFMFSVVASSTFAPKFTVPPLTVTALIVPAVPGKAVAKLSVPPPNVSAAPIELTVPVKLAVPPSAIVVPVTS